MRAIASLEIVICPSGDASACSASIGPLGRAAGAEGCARRALNGLLDLAGLEAARADVGAGGLALQEHADALEIRVEAPLRGDHRMAPVVTETGLLPADCADLGHRGRMVAEGAGGLGGRWPRGTAMARRVLLARGRGRPEL